MSNPYTYRDPTLSLWQSAVAEAHRRRTSVQRRMADSTTKRLAARALAAANDLMAPANLIGNSSTPDLLFNTEMAPLSPEARTAVPIDCAKLAAQFLWAEITGDTAKADVLSGELKYAVCDATGWSECVTLYLAYKAGIGPNPYQPNKDVVIDLGARSKIAIVGDWGTGDDVAINLLQQVATFKPDVLIHLGDIYYAGTQNEASANFLDICHVILGTDVPLFTLCGNHDMYSGGVGYYWLVDQIGQQASYFCLQNANWQFLGMDTGNNDNNPFTVATNMTSPPAGAAWSEADWHLNKIANAGTRRNVLLSHHQPFSAFSSVGSVDGREYAYNPNLYAAFKDVLPKIDWWFFGHEHTLAIYPPYTGIQRARCVGASAVPVFIDQQNYETAAGYRHLMAAPCRPGTLRVCSAITEQTITTALPS